MRLSILELKEKLPVQLKNEKTVHVKLFRKSENVALLSSDSHDYKS